MSAITGPDNSDIYSLERYIAAISIFGPASQVDAVDASFCRGDFRNYSDLEPGLEEEAESLSETELFHSHYAGAIEGQVYTPKTEEVLEAAGEIKSYMVSEYSGDVDRFVEDFSSEDREKLRDRTGIIELLEPC